MNRAEKVENVAKLNDRFGRAPIAVVTEYRGLNVAEMTELRGKLRAVDGEYVVSKMTLAEIAIKGAVLDGETLNTKQVEQLATMPSRDEMRAKLLALLNTPATNFVRLLTAPAQQMVQVLHARSEQEA